MNKLKILSITILCFVSALLTTTQGIEQPAGTIIAFAGEKVPSKEWLMCDGRQYSSRKYPILYDVVTEKYVPATERIRVLQHNVNPVNNNNRIFFVPDLRGRVIVGIDGGINRITVNNKLGESGGEENHQLTIAELASHSHPLPASGSPGVGIQPRNDGARMDFSIPMDVVGGDKPHNNMQPYLVLNYIINTGNEQKKKLDQQQAEYRDDIERAIEKMEISSARSKEALEKIEIIESNIKSNWWPYVEINRPDVVMKYNVDKLGQTRIIATEAVKEEKEWRQEVIKAMDKLYGLTKERHKRWADFH